jgi:hypothetical protein
MPTHVVAACRRYISDPLTFSCARSPALREFDRMRLAATLTTLDFATAERGSARQPVALRGTLRDGGDAPSEIAIVDVSESGFLAELPAGIDLPLDAQVRIAATLLGIHNAVVVRRDGRSYGFAFVRPIGRDVVGGLDAEQPSTVTAFPGRAPATFSVALPERPAPSRTGLSPRASLAIMLGVSAGLWLALAGVVAALYLVA